MPLPVTPLTGYRASIAPRRNAPSRTFTSAPRPQGRAPADIQRRDIGTVEWSVFNERSKEYGSRIRNSPAGICEATLRYEPSLRGLRRGPVYEGSSFYYLYDQYAFVTQHLLCYLSCVYRRGRMHDDAYCGPGCTCCDVLHVPSPPFREIREQEERAS